MKKQIPSTRIYEDTLDLLNEKEDIRTVIICRLAAEGSCSRIEIANAKIEEIDSTYKRGLELSVAKRVKGKHAKESHMRTRCIPLNYSLYNYLLNHLDLNQTYVISRRRGDLNKAFNSRHINYFLENANLSFTAHHLRHYFRTKVWEWMVKNRQQDVGILKQLMGHSLSVSESYHQYSWHYKLELVDKVFCGAHSEYKRENDMDDLKNAITEGIIKGQAEIEKKSYLFVTNLISKILNQFTPSDLYMAIKFDASIWKSLPLDDKTSIRKYRTSFVSLDADEILQLINDYDSALYSTILNSPKGLFWIHKQIHEIKQQIMKI